MTTTGTAYAFFYCSKPKDDIQNVLPSLKAAVGAPSNLELTLLDGPENLNTWDPRLWLIKRDAQVAGMNYVLQATYAGATDKQAATELSSILNQAYQSPLYQAEEPFKGQIYYKHSLLGGYTSVQ